MFTAEGQVPAGLSMEAPLMLLLLQKPPVHELLL